LSTSHDTDDTFILYDNDYDDEDYSMDNSFDVEVEDEDDHYIAFANDNLFVLPNGKDVLDDLSFTFDSFNDNSKIDTKRDNMNNDKTDHNNFDDKDEIVITFIPDVIIPNQLFLLPDGRDVLDDRTVYFGIPICTILC